MQPLTPSSPQTPSATPSATSPVSPAELRRKIHACWLGKAIGGTLGGPHEGKPGPLNLSFYDPVPAKMLPNDDLDLQIVWLHHLRATGSRSVTPEILSDAWQKYVGFPWDEYGVARRNRALGLSGEAQGAYDNFFGECMGAAIRSELWACVAPGDPARAAGFAWADAVVDHTGEGVWAEVFHAAIQSAAFACGDRDRLIAVGLGVIPADTRLARAIRDTVRWWREEPDWRRVRERIVHGHGRPNFTDVVANLAFEILGWLAGGGDFGKSLCIAVNCGRDTDCTGATLGALLGIIDPDGIPASWRAPIGEEIVLFPGIVGLPPPGTLTSLTEETLQLGLQLAEAHPALPPVPALRPAGPGAPFKIAGKMAHSAMLQPDAGQWEPRILFGQWLQLAPGDFAENYLLLELQFELPVAGPARLLAYADSEMHAWVDGQLRIHFTRQDLLDDAFLAPSFHRAGKAACLLGGLDAGVHRLTLAIARATTAEPVNMVFGLGDPSDHHWLADPFGFKPGA